VSVFSTHPPERMFYMNVKTFQNIAGNKDRKINELQQNKKNK
jgi:hypothetical protein